MVKVSNDNRKDCCAYCQNMGKSIILDPLDHHRISLHLNLSFEELLRNIIELNIVDEIILSNLKIFSHTNKACIFLNAEGRCNIHSFCPGLCGIFPSGRIYENNNFFLHFTSSRMFQTK